MSGEPGIGKTRLADELSALAGARGMQVLWGRCWEAGGAPAYWPWLDVVAGAAEQVEDQALREVLGDGATPVVELAPALRVRLPDLPAVMAVSPQESRFRLFRAVGGLLRRASAARALLIVLDDLHAADESSLLLLHFVARELRSMRVFVLGTFRDVEARLSAEIGEALGRLTREGTLLSLARLDAQSAGYFLAERAGVHDPAIQNQIFRRTQGNPLFLEELARLFAHQGQDGLAAGALPAGVRDVIRQRLARVSNEARAWLEVAAVLGDEMEPVLVAETTGCSVDEVEHAFQAAQHAGVLIARGRSRFRFSHALVREVLERDLSGARKQQLHAQVAAVLELRAQGKWSPPHAELAHHFLEAQPELLPQAVSHAIKASEQALMTFAFEDAIALLERVLEAVQRAAGPPRMLAEVLLALGQAQIHRGAGVHGRELCKEALEIGRALGDAELLAWAALAYGLEITAALVDPVLVSMLQEALAALPVADSPLRVQVTARLGAAMQPAPDMSYPIRLAQEAIASARRIGRSDTLLGAIYTGMAAMMDVSDPRERLPLNLEVEQLATAHNDREKLLRTQARLVFDHLELGQLDAADARIDSFERIAQQAGAQRYLWRVPLFRSMRAMMHGRFAQAAQLAEQARALGLAAQDPQLERCYAFHHEGLLRAWERHEEMLAYDVEARHLRAALYSGPHWQNGGSALTYARTEAMAQARMYLDLVPQDDWPRVQNPPAFMLLGEPLATFGERAQVETLYAQLTPGSHRCVSWGWTMFIWDGTATRVLGLLAARLSRWQEADAYFEAAIARFEEMAATPYLARTRYEYGRALLGREGTEHAHKTRSLMEQALASATELGMSGLCRLASQRLAQLGLASPSPSPHAPSVALASPAPAPRPPSPAPAALAASPFPFALVPEGEYWTIRYRDQSFRLRESLGLQYLARLIAEPGRAISALELSSGGKAGDPTELTDRGDAGEVLDERALASYRARLQVLRDALEQAEELGDAVGAERANEEIEFLGAELSRAVGLGGRRRRAGGAAERARSAVQRRIRNTLERIRVQSPALATLLERSVKTGTLCVFRWQAPELG